jgi:SAM-dependent methyltransferase
MSRGRAGGGDWGALGRRSLDSRPLSEPCACPPDPQDTRPSARAPLGEQAAQIGQHFDERFQDWEPVGPDATDLLFTWLRDEGLAGSTLMDVGCGTGELIVRALEAGAARATGADLSSEAIAMASELVEGAGLAERTDLWVGDAAVEELDPHDIVVLDKVICCYPDADALIARSTSAANRIYAFAVPESKGIWGLIARTRWFVFGVMDWLQGDTLPRFVHSRTEVERKVVSAGFRPLHTGRNFVWFVGVYARDEERS